MKLTAALAAMRESTDDELVARTKRLEEELFQLRMKRFSNQLENVNLIDSRRREIARCKTLLSARYSGIENQAILRQAQDDPSTGSGRAESKKE